MDEDREILELEDDHAEIAARSMFLHNEIARCWCRHGQDFRLIALAVESE